MHLGPALGCRQCLGYIVQRRQPVAQAGLIQI
jgi:hypothetical protein